MLGGLQKRCGVHGSSPHRPAAGITQRTEQVIKNYLRKVYDKLGVSDRLELALYCLHHELLKKYTTEAESALLQQTEPTQPLRAKM